MNAYRSRPLNFPWPPLLYGAAMLCAIVLHRFYELPSPELNSTIAWAGGALMIVLAVSLDIWAIRTLIDSDTTILPHRCATHLVTRGPFRFTRNPIYLGYTLMTAAMGLLTGNAWFFVMAVLAALMTTFVAIRHEERHLLARFGIEYENYCKNTRRWV
ncbi:isoprenylcysteine carboxylmethyltransferase family protein [Rhizobiaceae bacterium n13]|uniref:Isoprenylcysteine carboxylmethyltransferase family protein n=1 Tax=Ferirhizobium litorale TaxID=2927786 RepID=A0AAE3QJY5_9HYPH|nr:isoprenylcysteine carboxylmethyltransferase family protein [Fererhizobium litorale]MDI7864034.1 isoprenylcysteine carboxylmethyltransferase family protein [Fererhizobium litorale]MDI7924483.1 isoprenylcysteine carboxylmethyltransferase family protein [Fererhizobium litorale]